MKRPLLQIIWIHSSRDLSNELHWRGVSRTPRSTLAWVRFGRLKFNWYRPKWVAWWLPPEMVVIR